MRNITSLLTLTVVAGLLSGCAATQLAIRKHHLAVETKSSASIFLDPVPDREKVIYVQLRNTSDHADFSIAPELTALLKSKGYRVTHHLGRAHYLLQANILQVGKADPSALQQTFAGGYGSVLSGSLAGLATAAAISHQTSSYLAGGVIGGLVSTIADSAVKDVVFSAITDVQISERVKGRVKENRQTALTQGTSGEIVQTGEQQTHWARFRTRVLSRAERVNLSFKTALPKLKAGLSTVIAGFF